MEMIYQNPLRTPGDTKAFVLEGQACVTFPHGRMRLENKLDESQGQKANYVYWCDRKIPDDVVIQWEFWPIREPGLCMMLFSANGVNGEDIFGEGLKPRTGEYQQYNNGDINALHISYFRRKYGEERAFHTCNLRKSKGFHLVCQGADPLPGVEDARGPYVMQIHKAGSDVSFVINGLTVLRWADDGKAFGKVLGGGRLGFRQMAPMIGEYANLTVFKK